MRFSRILCLLTLAFIACSLSSLTVTDNNLLEINGSRFRLELESWYRVSDYVYQPITFSCTSQAYADSTQITYSSPQIDLVLALRDRQGLDAKALLATARMTAHTDINIRNLSFNMVYNSLQEMSFFKGPEAIYRNNPELNRNITPYTDKVIEYRNLQQSFWIVASNYADCKEVEYITPQQIHLYDNKLHFFRQFRPSTNAADLPRDCSFKRQGETHEWSFLIFEEKPLLLWINRWPSDKQAAFSISNDADGETIDRLAAVYYGTNNRNSPLYMNQGIIANNIKISHTTFGEHYLMLKDINDKIVQHGTALGYHTYANLIDPPGTNAQALLHDYLPYNIRTWIDHSVPNNPEDLAWNGLIEGSANYIGDVINQSNIDYAWMADTPDTNPFNAFDDPWRLPHLLYELTALEKPVWFFGRTRTQAWEYLDNHITIDLKHHVTPENLDRLLIDHGLNICYTHFCFANNTLVNSYYITTPEGECLVRPEVEEMWQMLDYYQTHRGLWIETLETIFDRMLATEKVYIKSVNYNENNKQFSVTMRNDSDLLLEDFYFRYGTQVFTIPSFPAKGEYELTLNQESNNSPYFPDHKFIAYQKAGHLYVKDTLNPGIDPVELQLFNLRGQLIQEHVTTYPQAILSVPTGILSSGIYFVRLKFNGNSSINIRFVVVK